MTVTDQIKILYDKIKSNQAQYDLGKEATRISVLSFKNLLDKYGYSIQQFKPNVFEKAKFQYSPLGVSLSKALKKEEVKSVTKSKMDLNYNSNHTIYKSCKGYDKFGET